jgi:hypothetical protein
VVSADERRPANARRCWEEARIPEATAVRERFKMTVSPAVIRHRQEFQTAVEMGKAVRQLGAKGKGAADEIRAPWHFPDGCTKSATAGKPKRKVLESKS